MADRSTLARKIANGQFADSAGDPTARLAKGDKALIAYVGYAYIGRTLTKFSPDKPIEQLLVFFDILSGPAKGCRHGEQMPLKEGDRAKKGTMVDAISRCTGKTFTLGLENLGTVIETTAQADGKPVYDKMRWGFSTPPAGSPEKVEVEDPIWLPKVRPSSMSPELYLAQYKLVCSTASWWEAEFKRSVDWAESELCKLLEAEANPH